MLTTDGRTLSARDTSASSRSAKIFCPVESAFTGLEKNKMKHTEKTIAFKN
jgi:hypothetical protein